MRKSRFYVCGQCGNMIGMIHDAGAPIMCCGQKMAKLDAGASDAGREKHAPAVAVSGDHVTVDVGAVAHPMESEHRILWVYLETDRGGQRKCFTAQDQPAVSFALCDEKPTAVYACCNRHGLWRTDIG